MERLGIVIYTFYTDCFMDLNREPPVSARFSTYVEIRTVYRQKRIWREFLVRNYEEEYYRVVIESPAPFVTPLLRVHIVIILTLY